MNGKIVLCFAAVFIGQAISAATPSIEIEDFKKMGEQLSQSIFAVANHVVSIYPTTADAQKSMDKVKSVLTKGLADIDTEAGKLKEMFRKNADPKLVEKMDEIEKELKKHAADAKALVDEKFTKPLNEKLELKKVSESLIKTTKEIEATMTKAIDGIKKQ